MEKSKYLLIFFAVINMSLNLYSQQIENVRIELVGQKYYVYYDIVGAKSNQEIEVLVNFSPDKNQNYQVLEITNNADIELGLSTVKKKIIVFDGVADAEKLENNYFALELKVRDKKMVFINGGTFKMGCSRDRIYCSKDQIPVHEVTVEDFYISRYEVTIKEFKEFIDATGYITEAEIEGYSRISPRFIEYRTKKRVTWICNESGKVRPQSEYNHPVLHVSWNDANEYCKWKGGRLPTEAEWEYVARYDTRFGNYIYSGSNIVNDVGWTRRNSGKKTHPVGQKLPNELDVYDMTGNVWEWCSDWKGEYPDKPKLNPKGPEIGIQRVIRGGSWRIIQWDSEVCDRYYAKPSDRGEELGFRLVISH